ncbi:SET domain-containing protein-lysine N-methyltransferase [Zavarzinella formosa]|uniref:SET domain-containing protein-lysine N-methyltransferase n=1 Tax=Zavarzinella formosa TaxID=360055 RepID=UPI00036A9FF8|nr:SET domain-containing protein-lysine N-methyltransferase [Zavarzinella formosa]
MSIQHPSAALYVRNTRTMGRGVFAGRPFRKGEVIEVCPVLTVNEKIEEATRDHALARYVFYWDGKGEEIVAIAFGFGSLYNHSPEWNATFKARKKTKDIVFKAARDIAEGEQIFINYDWGKEDYDFATPE